MTFSQCLFIIHSRFFVDEIEIFGARNKWCRLSSVLPGFLFVSGNRRRGRSCHDFLHKLLEAVQSHGHARRKIEVNLLCAIEISPRERAQVQFGRIKSNFGQIFVWIGRCSIDNNDAAIKTTSNLERQLTRGVSH